MATRFDPFHEMDRMLTQLVSADRAATAMPMVNSIAPVSGIRRSVWRSLRTNSMSPAFSAVTCAKSSTRSPFG